MSDILKLTAYSVAHSSGGWELQRTEPEILLIKNIRCAEIWSINMKKLIEDKNEYANVTLVFNDNTCCYFYPYFNAKIYRWGDYGLREKMFKKLFSFLKKHEIKVYVMHDANEVF